jgi:RNA polymerase sigma-70 factor (ECF subfamily)
MHNLDFEDLVKRFYPSLYRFALSLAKTEADACDLTQQTFQHWAQKGHQLRDATRVKAWLFTTLYREFVSAWNHKIRYVHHEIEEIHHELPVLQPKQAEEMDRQIFLEVLMEIEEIYRTPLALFYLEDYSYKEIAEILQIPIGTVMSRISRAKLQMKVKLTAIADAEARHVVPFKRAQVRFPHG